MNWLKKGVPKKILVISLVTTSTSAIYLLRDNYRGTEFKKKVGCQGKIAIVTGGNSGIGKETARELAKRGAIVYILCRDKIKCNDARKSIILSTNNRYVFARECDLGSLESVKNFADQFHKEQNRVDILVNNAGLRRSTCERTKNGFEIHLGVNYLGHFYLTNLLLDLLKKSAPSRIINVTCIFDKGKIDKEDLNSEKKYSDNDAYYQSKLATVLFTTELAERLKGTGVTANAVNPGATSTELYSNLISGFSASFCNTLIKPLNWIFCKTPVGGAQTTLYAAIDPDLENVSGKYFEECEEKDLIPQAKDPYTAKWLWAVSEKWTKLSKTCKEQNATTAVNS